jgi:small conductance mechanosensitive channel
MSFQKAFDAFNKEINEWADSIINGLPNLTAAFFALILFIILARIMKSVTVRVLDRVSNSNPVNRLSANAIAFVISSAGIIVALGIMNLDTTVTSLLTGAGIVGLGISFAFQDVIANTFSGILIAIQKPFQSGDYIESNDIYGIVKRIGLRQVEIKGLDGQDVWIPARQVLQNVFKNYTKTTVRRVVIETGISYGDDLRKVKEVTLGAIKKVNGIKPDEPTNFYYTNFGDSSINFMTFFWIDFVHETDYLQAVSDAIILIKDAYDENDITITFPIRTLDFGIKGGETFKDMLDQSGLSKVE